MPLHLPPELERRVTRLAMETHREPDSVLANLLEAALDDDEALPEAPLPHDWNDYLRYRFEQGRAAIARGEYSEASPAELMARVRARVEKNA